MPFDKLTSTETACFPDIANAALQTVKVLRLIVSIQKYIYLILGLSQYPQQNTTNVVGQSKTATYFGACY